jgi:predicted nuclease with TOPRIM domain
MSRNSHLLKERNEKIYKRYKELYDINFLRHTKVLEVLSKEFYIEPKTLEKIVLEQKKVCDENKKILQTSS